MGIGRWIAGAAAAGTAAEYGIAGCFFHRTMVRTNAVRQRTQGRVGNRPGAGTYLKFRSVRSG